MMVNMFKMRTIRIQAVKPSQTQGQRQVRGLSEGVVGVAGGPFAVGVHEGVAGGCRDADVVAVAGTAWIRKQEMSFAQLQELKSARKAVLMRGRARGRGRSQNRRGGGETHPVDN